MKDAAFSSARLLALYDRISDAEDAVPRLRRFVLDLAVRGKLVDQDASEEPASKLMRRAKSLKDEEGFKTKADPIQGDDIPFPAPLGWIWTRLGAIALQTGSGSTPRGGKSAYSDAGIPFLRSQNIYDEGLRLDDVVFINDETNEKMKRTKVKPKDLLLNITGGSIGRCSRIPDEFSGANVSQHVAIIRTAAPGTEDYLHLLVRAPFFQDYVLGEQTGAGRGGLPKNRMDRIPVPLPPLAEQHRIVAKVDELMALCDQLEQARAGREAVRDRLTAASLARLTAPETDAEALPAEVGIGSASGNATNKSTFQSHARFALQSLPMLTTRPDQIKALRQTILNLAVRGKLVEQDAEDEPAAELLKRIAREKAHLIKLGEIKDRTSPRRNGDAAKLVVPQGWVASNLQSICTSVTDGDHLPPPKAEQGIPFLVIGDVRTQTIEFSGNRFVSQDYYDALDSIRRPRAGDLLYTLVGSYGIPVMVRDDRAFCVQRHIGILRPSKQVDVGFLARAMESQMIFDQATDFATGIAQKTVPLSGLRNIVIPLPPLAEQHRIVAKVDALMALCDRLEASLTTAATTRSKLLNALLHEALEPGNLELEAAQ